jgi:hypothetical protein
MANNIAKLIFKKKPVPKSSSHMYRIRLYKRPGAEYLMLEHLQAVALLAGLLLEIMLEHANIYKQNHLHAACI